MEYSILKAVWAQRDERYSGRLLPPSQATAVVKWRISEAEDLEGPDREVALNAARRWKPPTPRWKRAY